MSIFIAIVQAILQSVAWIFPISESGHSAIYHDFANSVGVSSALTGVIHIGIALGIIFALFKLFVTLTKNFIGTFVDMFSKRLKGSSQSGARSFMYMTLVAFVPMILWCIPIGKGLLYTLLKSTGSNQTLLDDGLFIALLGALVLMAARMVDLGKNDKNVSLAPAIVTGVFSVLLVPVSGLSLVAGAYAMLMLFGISQKMAFRFSFVLSVPVLVVMGIVEICTATAKTGWIEAILALIISVAISFLAVRILRWIINSRNLKYFGFYDISIGVIAAIIGAFELIFK